MTRIVAGSAKGLRLAVPKSGTRPTSERVREALFSRLEHWGYIDDAVVADLYAGSGALGLEAASRGARTVVCVEAAQSAARVIARNVAVTGLAGVVTVNKKVQSYLRAEPGAIPEFDMALLDPPYACADDELADTLSVLAQHMVHDGLIVVERDKRSPEPMWAEGWELIDEWMMGDTKIWSARRSQSLNG